MKEVLPYLMPFATLIGGWFLGNKKRIADSRLAEAQADQTELGTVEKAIKIWRTLAQELQQEVEKLKHVVDELKVENEKLRHEVQELRAQLNSGEAYVD